MSVVAREKGGRGGKKRAEGHAGHDDLEGKTNNLLSCRRRTVESPLAPGTFLLRPNDV